MKVLPDNIIASLDGYIENIRRAVSAHDLMQGFYDYAVELCTAININDRYLIINSGEVLSGGLQVISQYNDIIHDKYHKNTRQTPDLLNNGFNQDFINSFEIYLASDKPPRETENDVLTVASNTAYDDIDFDDMSGQELSTMNYEPTCPPIIPERDRVFFLDFHRTLKRSEDSTETETKAKDEITYKLTFDNERTLKINGVKIHDVNRGSEAHRILMQAFKNGGLDSVMLFSPRIRNLQQTMLNIGLPKGLQGLYFPVIHSEGGNFHNPVSQAELKKAGVPPLDLSQFEIPVNV